MKASEIIARLQQIVAESGDLDVVTPKGPTRFTLSVVGVRTLAKSPEFRDEFIVGAVAPDNPQVIIIA